MALRITRSSSLESFVRRSVSSSSDSKSRKLYPPSTSVGAVVRPARISSYFESTPGPSVVAPTLTLLASGSAEWMYTGLLYVESLATCACISVLAVTISRNSPYGRFSALPTLLHASRLLVTPSVSSSCSYSSRTSSRVTGVHLSFSVCWYQVGFQVNPNASKFTGGATAFPTESATTFSLASASMLSKRLIPMTTPMRTALSSTSPHASS